MRGIDRLPATEARELEFLSDTDRQALLKEVGAVWNWSTAGTKGRGGGGGGGGGGRGRLEEAEDSKGGRGCEARTFLGVNKKTPLRS